MLWLVLTPSLTLLELFFENKTSFCIACRFENHYLACYPKLNRCVHDNGGEFSSSEFQELIQRAGIINVPTTLRSLQGNSVCERMHQIVANISRAMMATKPFRNIEEAMLAVEDAIAIAVHASCCAVSRALGVSPGSFVFCRNILLDLHVIVDLVRI